MNNNVVYLEKSDIAATLATWFYCCMWQAYTAEKMGLVGYIHWPKNPTEFFGRSLRPHQDPVAFARQPNMYEWFCEQPSYTGKDVPPKTLIWEWEHCPELGEHNFMAEPLAVIKDWYHRKLIFNSVVKERVAALIIKYGINFDQTLAVTWRGCDSTDDGRPRMPIETYFPFIDAILEQEPNLHIFATAEETSVVDKVQARYPNVFTIGEFFSAPWGYRQHSEYINPASGYERGIQACCLMSVLSKCKHLVKNRSSVGMVASWLSDGNIVCLAHPENGGHGFDITKAEIKGKLYPLPIIS
jgi:hypothetical protein